MTDSYLRNVVGREATSRGEGPGNLTGRTTDYDERPGCWPVDAPKNIPQTNLRHPPILISSLNALDPPIGQPIIDPTTITTNPKKWTEPNTCFMQHNCMYDLFLHFNDQTTHQPLQEQDCTCIIYVIFSWVPAWHPSTNYELEYYLGDSPAYSRWVLGNASNKKDNTWGNSPCSYSCWRDDPQSCYWTDTPCECVTEMEDCPEATRQETFCHYCRHLPDDYEIDSWGFNDPFSFTSPDCCSIFEIVPNGEFGQGEAWLRWDMREYYEKGDPIVSRGVDSGLPFWVTFVASTGPMREYQPPQEVNVASFLSVPKGGPWRSVTCPSNWLTKCYSTIDELENETGETGLRTICDILTGDKPIRGEL